MPSYHKLRKLYGGDAEPPYYVIHSGGQILALCLRADFNPNIYSEPAEVWVGAQENVAEWGEKLAFNTQLAPIWVSEGAGMSYNKLGIFSVIGNTDDPSKLATASSTPGVGQLSRIVYVKKVVPLNPHAAAS